MSEENGLSPSGIQEEAIPVRERLIVELHRLMHGAAENEELIGVTSEEFRIACSGDASDVLSRSKELMILAVKIGVEEPWPIVESLEARLPDWFVKACRPEQTLEEVYAELEYRKSLSPEDREAFDASSDKRWEAGAWASSMNPDHAPDADPADKDPFDERQWHWLDAEVVDENTIVASIDMMDWEVLSDSFRWLFIAAGAVDVDGSTIQ